MEYKISKLSNGIKVIMNRNIHNTTATIAIMVNAPTLVSFDTFIFRVYMLKQNYQKILANWHCSFSGVPVSSYT